MSCDTCCDVDTAKRAQSESIRWTDGSHQVPYASRRRLRSAVVRPPTSAPVADTTFRRCAGFLAYPGGRDRTVVGERPALVCTEVLRLQSVSGSSTSSPGYSSTRLCPGPIHRVSCAGVPACGATMVRRRPIVFHEVNACEIVFGMERIPVRQAE